MSINTKQAKTLDSIAIEIEANAQGLREDLATLMDDDTKRRERTAMSDSMLQEFELLCSNIRAFATALKVKPDLPE